MRAFNKVGAGFGVLAITALFSSAGIAGDVVAVPLPGPGILALVAAGVVAAIAIARSRR